MNKFLVFFKIIFPVLNWETIRDLTQNKFISSFNIWLWIVPIIANIIEHIENPIHIVVSTSKLSINLQLPFSWQMFFFGALFISFGNLVFLLKCPEFIKKYKNFNSFKVDSESVSELEYFMEKTGSSHVKTLFNQYNEDKYSSIQISDLFFELNRFYNNSLQFARSICCCFYYVGLFFVGFVILKNIIFVIQTFM